MNPGEKGANCQGGEMSQGGPRALSREKMLKDVALQGTWER